ncbi:uncharacterized protein LOC110265914 [Arachis ipaensis]|uniref:uncharacterized protein LOC110265914 n=1 Tax=Arachis ipaensis TaxID=130454 RepID=UPI000A2B8E1D|nr:uncharacterized protein LOC110265914 [Arachis ipaensis]
MITTNSLLTLKFTFQTLKGAVSFIFSSLFSFIFLNPTFVVHPSSSFSFIFSNHLHHCPSSHPAFIAFIVTFIIHYGVFLERAIAVTKILTSITLPSISLSPPFALKIATRFVVVLASSPFLASSLFWSSCCSPLSLAVLLASLSQFCSRCCSKGPRNQSQNPIFAAVKFHLLNSNLCFLRNQSCSVHRSDQGMLNYDILILDWQPILAGICVSDNRSRKRIPSNFENRFLLQWLVPVKGGLIVFSFPHCSGHPL